MEETVPHTLVDSIIEEGRSVAQLPMHEGGSDEYAFQQLNEIGRNDAFTPLSYMSNYVSLSSSLLGTHLNCDIRSENEHLLKEYYSSKKSVSHAMYKHDSITNGSDISNTNSEGSKSHDRLWMNKFLDDSRYMANLSEGGNTLEVQVGNQDEEEEGEIEGRNSLRTHSAYSYFKHLQRLSAADLRRTEVLRRHNLWIPLIKKDWKNMASGARNEVKSIYDNKVCPLFIDGNEYIAGDYSLRDGNISIPSIFSDHKLPAFVYHCSVELNGEVYILGGLMPCHKYDDEAPSLANFHVDGIKNLPPPLLSSVVNNPSMINNCRLYVMSIHSNRLRRPNISGQVPPPLLCMEGSKLTERNIFFYGGFEIRTETRMDDSGSLLLRRRAYVNNIGYILDTMTFNFTKVELTAIPYNFVSYPTLAARFGHVQLSVLNNNNSLNHQGHNDFDKNSNGSHSPSVFENFHSPSTSPSVSLGSSSAKLSNLSHNSGVYAILIFGGYKQTGVDDYEAMNDLWRIDVPIIARGKRGYYKFGSTANASILLGLNPHSPWPSPRAFAANYSTNIRDETTKPDLLKRLQENFFIDKDTFPVADKSRPLFKSLPHARPEQSDVYKWRGRVRDENISCLSNTDDGVSLVKQRIASPSSRTPSTLRKRSKTQPYTEHEVLIIHGGSDKLDVCHDMWWYDIETETWSQIATLGKQKDSKMIPIRMGLVGHSLICVSGMAVCIGGLLQEDVDSLYFGVNYNDMALPPQLAIGSDFINIFDLSSQCLLEHTVTGDEANTYLVDDPDARINIIFSCGFGVIQFDGDILLFGGLVSRRSNASSIKLSGAILKCIVPSMKLAG